MTSRSHTRVRDIDRGLRAYTRSMSSLGSARVVAGVTESSGGEIHRSGATSMEVAAVHEFGSPMHPPVAFIRGTDEDARAQEAARASAHALATTPAQLRAELERVGEVAADGIRSRIEAAGLVDTGALLRAVTSEVRS